MIERALRELGKLGVHGEAGRHGRRDPGCDLDAVVTLQHGRNSVCFAAVVKNRVRPSSIALTARATRSADSDLPVLLVTDHVSHQTAELLRAREINFVDTSGNAHIDAPGLLLVVSGRPRLFSQQPLLHERIGNAALQVMFVLLRDEDATGLTVRELGARAGVSHGAASMALNAFDSRGWLTNLGRHGQPLKDPNALLHAWLQGFSGQLGPHLETTRATFPGRSSVEEWVASVSGALVPEVGVLGGEAAAMLGGHAIRPGTASVYVQDWNKTVMKALRLVPSAEGTVFIREAFAPDLHDSSDERLADPLLVLGELMMIPDERLEDARAALLDRVQRWG